MSLIGKYICPSLKATLQITEIDGSNGQGKGTFTIKGVEIPIQVQDHFNNDTELTAPIRFWGGMTNEDRYVGVAGYSTAQTYTNISFSGGYTIEIEVHDFSGNFIKK